MKTFLYSAILLTAPAMAGELSDLENKVISLRSEVLGIESKNLDLKQQLLNAQNTTADSSQKIETVIEKIQSDRRSDLNDLDPDKFFERLRLDLELSLDQENQRKIEERKRKTDRKLNKFQNAEASINSLISEINTLKNYPNQKKRYQERILCFQGNSNQLVNCLQLEIKDSKSLIRTNQFSISLNKGFHCKFFPCKKFNRHSRQIIAREQTRIGELNNRISTVRSTGDDPKKNTDITHYEGRLRELEQKKDEALGKAGRYKSQLNNALREISGDRVQNLNSRLQNCSISLDRPCFKPAEKVQIFVQKRIKFLNLYAQVLPKAVVELLELVNKDNQEVLNLISQIKGNDDRIESLTSRVEDLQDQILNLGGEIDENPISPSKDIRLTDNNTLELKKDGEWRGVCDDDFDQNDAEVACRQMGKTYQSYRTGTSGSSSFWLDDLRCNGSESSLFDCSHNGIGRHNCSSSENVQVFCQ